MRFTVKQARAMANLTQEEMAQKMGINRSTYIRIEKDVLKATVGQLKKVSDITGIPLEDIFLPEE